MRMVLFREGFMPEYYITKRGYLLQCDKLLHNGVWVNMIILGMYFLNDPLTTPYSATKNNNTSTN